eukprot:GHVH01002602.1.p1 GENE.GHVH01002602.1~~GHVH01002602.1.p1  ORF type:complete len:1127 (-),score=144.68 GHVH01002602.1:74-2974(-)
MLRVFEIPIAAVKLESDNFCVVEDALPQHHDCLAVKILGKSLEKAILVLTTSCGIITYKLSSLSRKPVPHKKYFSRHIPGNGDALWQTSFKNCPLNVAIHPGLFGAERMWSSAEVDLRDVMADGVAKGRDVLHLSHGAPESETFTHKPPDLDSDLLLSMIEELKGRFLRNSDIVLFPDTYCRRHAWIMGLGSRIHGDDSLVVLGFDLSTYSTSTQTTNDAAGISSLMVPIFSCDLKPIAWCLIISKDEVKVFIRSCSSVKGSTVTSSSGQCVFRGPQRWESLDILSEEESNQARWLFGISSEAEFFLCDAFKVENHYSKPPCILYHPSSSVPSSSLITPFQHRIQQGRWGHMRNYDSGSDGDPIGIRVTSLISVTPNQRFILVADGLLVPKVSLEMNREEIDLESLSTGTVKNSKQVDIQYCVTIFDSGSARVVCVIGLQPMPNEESDLFICEIDKSFQAQERTSHRSFTINSKDIIGFDPSHVFTNHPSTSNSAAGGGKVFLRTLRSPPVCAICHPTQNNIVAIVTEGGQVRLIDVQLTRCLVAWDSLCTDSNLTITGAQWSSDGLTLVIITEYGTIITLKLGPLCERIVGLISPSFHSPQSPTPWSAPAGSFTCGSSASSRQFGWSAWLRSITEFSDNSPITSKWTGVLSGSRVQQKNRPTADHPNQQLYGPVRCPLCKICFDNFQKRGGFLGGSNFAGGNGFQALWSWFVLQMRCPSDFSFSTYLFNGRVMFRGILGAVAKVDQCTWCHLSREVLMPLGNLCLLQAIACIDSLAPSALRLNDPCRSGWRRHSSAPVNQSEVAEDEMLNSWRSRIVADSHKIIGNLIRSPPGPNAPGEGRAGLQELSNLRKDPIKMSSLRNCIIPGPPHHQGISVVDPHAYSLGGRPGDAWRLHSDVFSLLICLILRSRQSLAANIEIASRRHYIALLLVLLEPKRSVSSTRYDDRVLVYAFQSHQFVDLPPIL